MKQKNSLLLVCLIAGLVGGTLKGSTLAMEPDGLGVVEVAAVGLCAIASTAVAYATKCGVDWLVKQVKQLWQRG